MKKAITVTNGYVVDSSLLTEPEWEELEYQLNNREISTEELAERIGLSRQELDNQLTHIEALVLDC